MRPSAPFTRTSKVTGPAVKSSLAATSDGLEQTPFEGTVESKMLDGRCSPPAWRRGGHDHQEVIPVPAGIQGAVETIATCLMIKRLLEAES